MATISVARASAGYRVTIRGTLGARDLKRLEHACRDALQHERLPIELDVGAVTHTDDAARTYLDRLRARGASLVGDPALLHSDDAG
jgi:hypothetical protein